MLHYVGGALQSRCAFYNRNRKMLSVHLRFRQLIFNLALDLCISRGPGQRQGFRLLRGTYGSSCRGSLIRSANGDQKQRKHQPAFH